MINQDQINKDLETLGLYNREDTEKYINGYLRLMRALPVTLQVITELNYDTATQPEADDAQRKIKFALEKLAAYIDITKPEGREVLEQQKLELEQLQAILNAPSQSDINATIFNETLESIKHNLATINQQTTADEQILTSISTTIEESYQSHEEVYKSSSAITTDIQEYLEKQAIRQKEYLDSVLQKQQEPAPSTTTVDDNTPSKLEQLQHKVIALQEPLNAAIDEYYGHIISYQVIAMQTADNANNIQQFINQLDSKEFNTIQEKMDKQIKAYKNSIEDLEKELASNPYYNAGELKESLKQPFAATSDKLRAMQAHTKVQAIENLNKQCQVYKTAKQKAPELSFPARAKSAALFCLVAAISIVNATCILDSLKSAPKPSKESKQMAAAADKITQYAKELHIQLATPPTSPSEQLINKASNIVQQSTPQTLQGNQDLDDTEHAINYQQQLTQNTHEAIDKTTQKAAPPTKPPAPSDESPQDSSSNDSQSPVAP